LTSENCRPIVSPSKSKSLSNKSKAFRTVALLPCATTVDNFDIYGHNPPSGEHGMSTARTLLGSTKGRLVIGALVCYLAWQGWLGVAAPGKIAAGLNTKTEKVNILVTLPFPPERFHVMVFQRYGRVSGTQDNSIEVRGVKKADLQAVARPYWVTRVEPLPTGG
jgi:hypothetical protein